MEWKRRKYCVKEAVLPPPLAPPLVLLMLVLLELEAAGAGAVEEDATGALTWARLFDPLPTCCAALLEPPWPVCPVLPEAGCWPLWATFCCPLVWPLCCPLVWPVALPLPPGTGATEELCAGDDDTASGAGATTAATEELCVGDDDTAFGAGTMTAAPPCCWTAPLLPVDPPCLWRALQVPA